MLRLRQGQRAVHAALFASTHTPQCPPSTSFTTSGADSACSFCYFDGYERNLFSSEYYDRTSGYELYALSRLRRPIRLQAAHAASSVYCDYDYNISSGLYVQVCAPSTTTNSVVSTSTATSLAASANLCWRPRPRHDP
ncbi:hypothetical protein PHYSODRAFT_305733 [Phytophthora sojae]|uniref:Uncharacterized protein n=1 Tax=Phytophthora sojae (strain P6497) TaxID=1094619 RepID=G5A6B9_PHYSP|nr:hypothetical protein PHYSODRAFT_305733 [Phytophthora sojae]EGZ08874.1 hypothetical protein PHYSODRAFT_305733 [Phytophthora sojae]|eukprot:XP_009535507.1 hypothetical protein PHYSODRAFT_305733 [Phytophthora sojae]